jgi:hypothetical protein
MIGGIVLAVTLSVIGCCAFGVKKLVKKNSDEGGAGKIVDEHYSETVGGSQPPVANGYGADVDEEEGNIQVVQGAVVADEIPTVQGEVVTVDEKRLHDQIAQQ